MCCWRAFYFHAAFLTLKDPVSRTKKYSSKCFWLKTQMWSFILLLVLGEDVYKRSHYVFKVSWLREMQGTIDFQVPLSGRGISRQVLCLFPLKLVSFQLIKIAFEHNFIILKVFFHIIDIIPWINSIKLSIFLTDVPSKVQSVTLVLDNLEMLPPGHKETRGPFPTSSQLLRMWRTVGLSLGLTQNPWVFAPSQSFES